MENYLVLSIKDTKLCVHYDCSYIKIHMPLKKLKGKLSTAILVEF